MPKSYTQRPSSTTTIDTDQAQRVRFLTEQFDRYETYWRPEIERAIRNGRMYWQVNFGAWPAYVVEKLRSQGRRPPSFPVIPDKIETLVGSFLANDFDIRFEPSHGKVDNLCFKAQDMWFSDKYGMDWETPKIRTLLDSFILMGAERMTVKDSVDSFGNLGWENMDTTHLLLSPTWKTDDIDELPDYFSWTMMTARQIMEHANFKHNSERLRDLYDREEREGIDYGQYQGALPKYKTVDEKWSSMHRVIEFHYVVPEVADYEYDLRNHQWFPDTGYKMGSDDDTAVKRKYYEMMGLQPHEVTFLPRRRRIKRMETIVPTIDRELFLNAGKDMIQTNNVNLYPLGIRYKGQYQGIVDRLYDVQIAYNKGKMLMQDIQARSAHGAFFIDRMLSGGDVELERQIEAAWNDPAARIWVDEGSTAKLPNGGVVPVPTEQVSPDLFKENENYLELADRWSKVSAAQSSRTESKQEPARLFRYKLEVGQIGQKYMMKGYESHERKKASAYLKQIKITYAGTPRSFRKMGTKEVFWINQPGQNYTTGMPVIIDDITLLPEMDVIIVPDKSGINVRTGLRSQYAEMMEGLTDPRFELLKVTFMGLTLGTYQDMPDDDKEQVKHAVSLLQRQAAGTVALNVANTEQKLVQMAQKGLIAENRMQDDEEQAEPAVREGEGPPGQMEAGTPMQKVQ